MTRKGAYIKPNQELRDYIVLAKVFDLSNPGTYTVSAKKRVLIHSILGSPEIKWIVAESNNITFAVKQTASP